MLSKYKKYISDHDLAYINQETLIAGDSYGIKGYPNFNSPESLIDDLQDTGFNMASSATNHSMDLGKCFDIICTYLETTFRYSLFWTI